MKQIHVCTVGLHNFGLKDKGEKGIKSTREQFFITGEFLTCNSRKNTNK